MKYFQNIRLVILSTISLAFLSACGGSSYDEPDVVITPAPPPPPIPTFPAQTPAPENYVVNDNGALVLAESGLSLYTFDNDSINTSTCDGTPDDTDTCAGKWPPLLAADGATATADMTIINRSNGDKQWALKSQPLYQWHLDIAQGDIGGDNINNVWHLARPIPIKSTTLNNLASYVGTQTIKSVTSTSNILTAFRVDKNGFSLYTFDKDAINMSNCSGDCINIWPPLLADAGARAEAPLSLVDVADNNKQWAYKGKPLYFFKNDQTTGDTNGNDVKDVWHTATQEPAIQRTTASGRFLSATGQVDVLLSNNGSITNFTVTSMDKDGFALYTLDNDSNEQSNCEGQCLEIWPAFLPSATDQAIGDFTKFARSNGTIQWAYQGKPLYFFKNDLARSDINGDGVNGIWHLVLPPEPNITTTLLQETNTLGATITSSGDVHVMLRDTNGVDFVDTIIDKTGFALYTFDNDTAGISNCMDACLDAWPPLLADANDVATPPYSIITRTSGMMQWAINNMPLYFFTPDATADDTHGENVKSVWHVARPAPVKVDDNAKGPLLVAHGDVLDSQGKTSAQLSGLTLYTFDSDIAESGISQCFDGCATTWPPLYATSAAQAFGDFTIISRSENSTTTYQWAYQGLPLYFYVGDSIAGDTNGDYTSWTIARP